MKIDAAHQNYAELDLCRMDWKQNSARCISHATMRQLLMIDSDNDDIDSVEIQFFLFPYIGAMNKRYLLK